MNIVIDENAKTYIDKDTGIIYERVSKLLNTIADDFNGELIAPLVAKKRNRISMEEAVKRGVSQSIVLQSYPIFQRGITDKDVLREWDEKRDIAIVEGNIIHNNCEKAVRFGIIENDQYSHYYSYARNLSLRYSESFCEKFISSDSFGIAGTTDLILKRTKSNKSICDYYDYKTNVIEFDSIGIDQYTKEVKHNNNFFKEPLEYLENCNYNKYALQLSIYAFLNEIENGVKPGKLAIINMPWENIVKEPVIIPVPYMKEEVIKLIKTKLLRDGTDISIEFERYSCFT